MVQYAVRVFDETEKGAAMGRKFFNNLIRQLTRIDIALMAVLALVVLWFNLFAGIASIIAVACVVIAHNMLIAGPIGAEIDQYEEKFEKSLSDTGAAFTSNAPLALCISDRDCILYYTNDSFDRIFADEEDFRKKAGKNFIRQFYDRPALKANISISQRVFRVSCAEVGSIEEDRRLFFFENVSAAQIIKKNFINSRACIALINIDNYDELLASSPVEDQSSITADIDRRIMSSAQSRQAAVVRIRGNRYMEVFEERWLDQLRSSNFPLLDDMHEVKTNADFPTSVSIGVGCGAVSLSDLQDYAEAALDLALGRGGDQAVIKSRGRDAEFFGGALTTVEKRNKGKSRIMAHALWQLLSGADKVIIMGHKNPDLDAIGSCIGVSAMARCCGIPSYIVMNDVYDGIDLLYNAARETGLYSFMTSEEALLHATENTVLVVTDVMIPYMTECPQLLERVEKKVVIDHHRRGQAWIQNPTLSYTETYASSASELVTELLQYSGDKVELEKFDADALLAGITLDTKNFTVNTGVRTFEAASWLKRCGADTAEVRSFFKSRLDAYKKKVNIIASAEEVEEGIAVAYTNDTDPAMQILVAQAANELLEMRGIRAAIVAGKGTASTVVSARSDGSVNVQVLMEKLGGGGHVNVAAAQVQDAPEIAIQNVVSIIREMKAGANAQAAAQ